MIILGLDPGLANFGFALLTVDDRRSTFPVSLIDAGALHTSPDKGANTALDRHRRACEIAKGLRGLLAQRPHLVACEVPLTAGAQGRGTVAAILGGYAAGVVAAVVGEAGAPVTYLRPRDWRRRLLLDREDEAAAHRHVELVLGADGFPPKKKDRPHALDAAGIALAAMKEQR